MGIYTSSDGTEKDTATMNSFNLVNGLIKSANQVTIISCVGEIDELQSQELELAQKNVQAIKDEILARLDTRPKTE